MLILEFWYDLKVENPSRILSVDVGIFSGDNTGNGSRWY